MNEKLYWLGFSCFPGVGPKKFQLLLNTFGTAENAWHTSPERLEATIGKALTAKFVTFRQTFSFERYQEKLADKHVDFVTLVDEAYPELLRAIADPPFVLYVRGTKEILRFAQNDPPLHKASEGNRKYIAIVGTRKITAYGREVTTRLTEQLVAAGYVIVSGLAFGVDATAHKTCIDAGGKTIAVLGCGVDCCYPSSNKRLYDEIIQKGGAIVSEFPVSMEPSLGSFPSRNRIIAGLSEAVIVTEGAEDSGALYTAEDAFAVGRKVFAVPGPITSSLSKGPNALIKKGATLVTSAEEIFETLQVSAKVHVRKSAKEIKGDTGDEQKIIDLLQLENLHFDELVRRTNMNPSEVGGLLSLMELKGMVKSLDSGVFGLGS